MKVYIVRYGQVLHNALKQYNSIDEDLTELGIKQAKELRAKIKDIEYDIVICSPLKRAIHTANIINIKNRDIVIDYRLKERDPGSLNGLKTKEHKNVLIVAHSGVSKAFNGYFYGIFDGKFLNRGLKNCEIKEYEL